MPRLRFANHRPIAQTPQTKPVPFVHRFESHGMCRRRRSGLTEVFDDVSFFSKDRDHEKILT